MELNATLIVQVGHFLCAYIIIDRVLLRPAIARIQADDRKHAILNGEVQDSQQRIVDRTRYNEQDWLILQKRLQAECPEQKVGKHIGVATPSSSKKYSCLSKNPLIIADNEAELIAQSLVTPLVCCILTPTIQPKDYHD